jgi:hypothetical protein
VAVLDVKWQVPDGYDITERDLVLPPPRGYTGAQPMLGILSVRALEDQATSDGQIALFAWQVMAGAWQSATETIDRLANSIDMSGLELLIVGHAYAATDLAGGASFETAQRARKILKQPVTAQSIDASLLLAVTALPFGAERVRTLLDMLGAELQAGTDEHHAVHTLLRAAADPTVSLDDAYTMFSAIDDHFGLAQCALIGHARELATTRRPEALRGYLEHAIYRYEADGRPEWAARTISHALVPLLADELKADPGELAALFGRAIALGIQARSQYTVESVFRVASKLGFGAQLSTLSQFDPPRFAKRDPSAAPPPEEPKPEAKPKKPAAKKPGKKRAS